MIRKVVFCAILFFVSRLEAASWLSDFDSSLPVTGTYMQNGVRVSKLSIIRGLREKEVCAASMERMKKLSTSGWSVVLGYGVPLNIIRYSPLKLSPSAAALFMAAGLVVLPVSLEVLSKSDYYFHKALLAHNASVDSNDNGISLPRFLPIKKEGKQYTQDGIVMGMGLPYVISEQPRCRPGIVRFHIYKYSAIVSSMSGIVLLATGLYGLLWEPETGGKLMLGGAGCFAAGVTFNIALVRVLRKTVDLYNKDVR
jgi:hypothetical protein